MTAARRSRVAATLRALALGAGGFLALQVWGVLLLSITAGVVGPLGTTERTVVTTAALGLAMASVAGVYLERTGQGKSFLDFRVPTRRDVAYVVGGTVALFAVLVALDQLATAVGVSTAEHSIEQQARQGDAEVLLVLVPLSFLVVGPGEELLYRNVVQKSLAESFSQWRAIGLASAVFALVHVSAYQTGDTTAALAATLAVIFALSVVLGVLYERTQNTTVPALVHGAYNAVQFVLLYVEVG